MVLKYRIPLLNFVCDYTSHNLSMLGFFRTFVKHLYYFSSLILPQNSSI
nr:MAG TPA: hypothetical protein [Caudoviricetes sp.]DAN68999.1 MAG TPA: hypothetical protein [Caudoviricetes sp.]